MTTIILSIQIRSGQIAPGTNSGVFGIKIEEQCLTLNAHTQR